VAEALTRLVETQHVVTSRQTLGNAESPQVSVYNPQGDREYPRPALVCRMFLPWEADWEALTYEEIELLNLLPSLGPGEYPVRLNDGSKATVSLQIERGPDGRPHRLLLSGLGLFDNEKHRLAPPLASLLRQLLASKASTRKAAEQVLTMEEREEKVARGELPISAAGR
jgi:hypothetical protein